MPSPEPLELSREGRALIPAKIRRQLQLEAGTELLGRVEDGRLILETRSNALRRRRPGLAELGKGGPRAGALGFEVKVQMIR